MSTFAATPSRTANRAARNRGKAVITYMVLVVGSLLFFTPLFWQISTSLKTSAQAQAFPPVWIPSPVQFENYAALFERFPMATYIANSVFITVAVIIGTVVSSSLAAYGFARLRMPGRDLIFLILLSTLLLPGVVLIIPQFVMFQRLQWVNTYNPLIVPSFFGSAFSIFLLRQFFLTIPRELEDAARIDGAGFLRTFVQVVLPMAWPAVIAVALYTFLGAWNDFLGPLLYLSDQEKYTLPVALRFLQGSMRTRPENHLLMAAATVSMIPCILVFVFAQRWFMQGQVFTGVKG